MVSKKETFREESSSSLNHDEGTSEDSSDSPIEHDEGTSEDFSESTEECDPESSESSQLPSSFDEEAFEKMRVASKVIEDMVQAPDEPTERSVTETSQEPPLSWSKVLEAGDGLEEGIAYTTPSTIEFASNDKGDFYDSDGYSDEEPNDDSQRKRSGVIILAVASILAVGAIILAVALGTKDGNDAARTNSPAGSPLEEELSGLQMRLYGITSFQNSSQETWEKVTKEFSEMAISSNEELTSSLIGFETTLTVTNTLPVPAAASRRRQLQPLDSVLVTYNQTMKFIAVKGANTTDIGITAATFAQLPFETKEFQSAYIEMLQGSGDPVLQSIANVSSVFVPQQGSSSTSQPTSALTQLSTYPPSSAPSQVVVAAPLPTQPAPDTAAPLPFPQVDVTATPTSLSTTTQPTSSPTEIPTELSTNLDTFLNTFSPTTVTIEDNSVLTCSELCQGGTGVAVTANGLELKRAILEYMNDPSNSTYGADINCWDVSQVTDMSYVFSKLVSVNDAYDSELDNDSLSGTFNEPLNCWDVSSVASMKGMFADQTGAGAAFDEDITSWNVSRVIDMSHMFEGAKLFNQDLGDWDVSSVTNMSHMFADALTFNQNIRSWNVSGVTDMSAMFLNTDAFNQSIGGWDVANVNSMKSMFRNANAFNQDIGLWNVSNVADMSGMFRGAVTFDQGIEFWDVSRVSDMSSMFLGTKAFNRNLDYWAVSSVTDMSGMFEWAESFDQDIGSWDVSNVVEMRKMFSQVDVFNQDISAWNVSSTEDMQQMFDGADAFNQNLCAWGNLVNILDVNVLAMFDGSRCNVTADPTASSNNWCQACQSEENDVVI